MAVEKIEIHDRSVGSRKDGIKDWNISSDDKKDLLKFLDELELGKVNKGRKISESRQTKYLDSLKMPLEFFKKSTNKITMKDVEAFEKALSSGTLKSRKGEPYSQATKVDIRRTLRIYLKWKLGETKANKLTDWFDTRDVVRTPDYIKESDIRKLYKHCKSSEERFIIAVLFDTGARATEFHNIRYEDIHLPEKGKNYVKITLKEEYSKTKGRTISLYWENSLEAIRDYIKEREAEGIRSTDAVFKGTYDASRFFLMRLGKKILDRSIHYHLFRHSSATYYATKLNRQQLCYRYGWAFSSNMPDVYISRSGMENQEVDEAMTQTELSDLKTKIQKQEQEFKMKQDEFEKEIGYLKKNLDHRDDLADKAKVDVSDLQKEIEKMKKMFLKSIEK